MGPFKVPSPILDGFPCFSSFYYQVSWHLNLFQIKIPNNESKFLFNLTWDLQFFLFFFVLFLYVDLFSSSKFIGLLFCSKFSVS